MSTTINFMGQVYAGVEDMPPEIREAYDRMRAAIARKYPDRDVDEVLAGAAGFDHALMGQAGTSTLPPAWGGKVAEAGIPVPVTFDVVSGLGPATAVFGRDSARLFPGFGAPNALVLYRYGFAWQTGSKNIHAWRWEDVTAIVSNVSTESGGHSLPHANHEYTLLKKSGEKFVLFDALKDTQMISDVIKRNVFALLLPPLIGQYEAGQPLVFGPQITIHSQAGLRTGGRLYAWSEIIDIKVEQGRFKITLRDAKQREIRVAAIPNIEMLCQLIGLKLLPDQLTYY
jgi:hypothetical protein